MSNRGRPRTSCRVFEHLCPAIDAAEFKKITGFKPAYSYEFLPDIPDFVLNLSVSYRWEDGKTESVALTTTSLPSGGLRYWFRCRCGRRARKLYTDPESHIIACRTCFGLMYESQYRKGARSAMFRMIRKRMKEAQLIQ